MQVTVPELLVSGTWILNSAIRSETRISMDLMK